ncbi:cell wall hydrolase [Selenihalanaerobacter shriftii]|uniref:Cell Wall Hydrolase n=1 Tax=Selenihalanaerobacter shriftii TaxID=142842 RepID=A0A1T4JLR7_9FIRM|nr:cell wall hydrolase [Selenihalanaerobacter shriftii]SJZ31082.1 Cell Wall Hydrolase [Selenihalanaerobacter shriftii]
MNKLKKIISIKILILTLVFTLVFPYLSMIVPIIDTPNAYASSVNIDINEDDAAKGLALVLALTLISNYFDDKANANNGIDNIEDNDLRLLARLIHAESRGEPYKGQIAVGAVVLNRVKSEQFPNSIRGVVYQDGQFTPVENGQINLAPNQTSVKAARAVLKGKDPSLGALYFYNPKKARTLWWLSTRDTTIEIGNHVFAK